MITCRSKSFFSCYRHAGCGSMAGTAFILFYGVKREATGIPGILLERRAWARI
jgi:hypothetical protein